VTQKYVLALDQGTTSSRAIAFSPDGQAVATAQEEFPQILPQPGHVEHAPEAIWDSQIRTAKRVVDELGGAEKIAAIGITNQRETTIVWDRQTGRPVANAIVWQSRITAGICEQLRSDGYEESFRKKTGLVVDAYFSGTKLKHILDQVDPSRERAQRGDLLFGTVDAFLLWRLTGGRVHVTDVSNASRTLMFNIHTLEWDSELLDVLGIPQAMLPTVLPSSHVYGETDPDLFGRAIPVSGIAGDQQAATFGQACFEIGSAKNTFGTGAFMLMNTGSSPVESKNNLLTTIGWSIGDQTTYCLEGSVFVSGAVVQWLRDGLGVIAESAEVEKLAAEVDDSGGVYVVPAFVGMGAPYWDPYARGVILGLTRGTTAAHIARASIEAMAFQTRDLIEAMEADCGARLAELKVDGGASANDSLLQFQSDLLDVAVRRPEVVETTALGAAYLAGLAVGVWSGLDDVRNNWRLDCEFQPSLDDAIRQRRYSRWKKAVERSLDWEERDS